MITTRVVSKFSTVLKDFVYTVYGPYNVSKLLQTHSMLDLVKKYLEENVGHGANLYRELEDVETILQQKAPKYIIRNAEAGLGIWMKKMINERMVINERTDRKTVRIPGR